MREQSITRKQPLSLFSNNIIFGTTPETEICLNCTVKICNGDCKRYKDEMKRLKIHKCRKINDKQRSIKETS